MSEFYDLAGATPVARKPLVRLEKPYRKIIREAIVQALYGTIDWITNMLIYSAFSPVPKDTGFLRSALSVDIHPSGEGVSLILAWKGVPYAQHLIAQAGMVNVRHDKDPAAENPWMEPAMRMVWPVVFNALQQELTARGIEYTVG
jgi:hypothetical protein